MKKLFTLTLILLGGIVLAQEFKFNIHNTSLSEYIEMEENLGSERIETIRNHVSMNGDAQPIKFKREQEIISDLVAYYYFKEKDSVMSYILYEWDESLLSLKPNSKDKKSKEYQKALIEKFNTLEKELTELYAEPKARGDLSDLDKAEQKGGLKRNCKWYPDDKTEIEMYIVVSYYYEKRGLVTISPTHRIRLYIRKLD